MNICFGLHDLENSAFAYLVSMNLLLDPDLTDWSDADVFHIFMTFVPEADKD